MCGRYTVTRQDRIEEDLQATLGDVGGEWWKPRFNVAPTQPAPVVTLHDGARTVELMRWGLVPFWAANDVHRPPLMINARAESLLAKQWFREALQRRRCLVPADGFFEWRRGEGGKGGKPLPVYFHPAQPRVFAFAGLWARAKTDGGELLSFTIITGKPTELVAPVHDRMPVVLDPGMYGAWLDPTIDEHGARELLQLPDTAGWRADEVSTRVNNASNDDPSCIEPEQPPPAPRQGSLF